MMASEEIYAEISPMNPVEKIRLIDKILNSLNQTDRRIDKIWANEAEERIKAYENGTVSTVNESDVFAKYQK